MRRETYVGWCVGKEINSGGRGILGHTFGISRRDVEK
jgi:hypothetical protein